MSTNKKSAPGSFWERDESFGAQMDKTFEEGELWLAHSCEQDEPFTPEGGKPINRTKFLAQKIDPDTMRPYGVPMVVKTLSQPIYENAGAVKDGDFPCVVKYEKVEVKKYGNEATVLRRACAWPVPQEWLDLLTTFNPSAE